MRLTDIPLWGIWSSMQAVAKKGVLRRLKRIEGQVRGVAGMVGDDRYCVDILAQLSAVRAALHKAEEEILRDHVSHCVAGAFSDGDVAERRNKIEELVDTVGRMSR